MAPMKAAYPRVSFADLERWREDGRRYELYDGDVCEVPSPLPLHQIAAGRRRASTFAATAIWCSLRRSTSCSPSTTSQPDLFLTADC